MLFLVGLVFALETEKTMSRGKTLVEDPEPLWREGQAGPGDPVIRVAVPPDGLGAPGGLGGLAADELEALLELEGPYSHAPALMKTDPPLNPMGQEYRYWVNIIGPPSGDDGAFPSRTGRVVDGGQRTVDIGERLPNGPNESERYPRVYLTFKDGQVQTIATGASRTLSEFEFDDQSIKIGDFIDSWAQFEKVGGRIEHEEIWRGKDSPLNGKTLLADGSKPEALYVQKDYQVLADDPDGDGKDFEWIQRGFPAASLQIMHYGRVQNKNELGSSWTNGIIVDLGRDWNENKVWNGPDTLVTVMADNVEGGTPLFEIVPMHQLLVGFSKTKPAYVVGN